MKLGATGASYNIGGDNEWKNIELVETLCVSVKLTVPVWGSWR